MTRMLGWWEYKGLDWDKALAKGYTMPWVPDNDVGDDSGARLLIRILDPRFT